MKGIVDENYAFLGGEHVVGGRVYAQRWSNHERRREGFTLDHVDSVIWGAHITQTAKATDPGSGVTMRTTFLAPQDFARSANRGREQPLYDYYRAQGANLANVKQPVAWANINRLPYHATANLFSAISLLLSRDRVRNEEEREDD